MGDEIAEKAKANTKANSEVAVFELDIGQTGFGSVKLNGHKLPRVRAVSVKAEVSTATIVTLEFIAAEVRGVTSVDISHMGHEWCQFVAHEEPPQ